VVLFSTTSRPALEPTQPPRVPGALSQDVKRQRRDGDQSSPSSAEVKNGGVIPPLLTRLHVVMFNQLSVGTNIHFFRDKFTIFR
jgi:hypothetical protein